MIKRLMFLGIAVTLQLSQYGYEVIAESQPVNIQKRSIGPSGGFAVEHPLQATLYANRKGKISVLVPFEIMIVPMGGGSGNGAVLEPERLAPKYPISGPVRMQPIVNQYPNNVNSYRPYTTPQFGPSYYPAAPSYQPHQQYQQYAPFNGYNNGVHSAYNNGYNNYNPYNNGQYYQPSYRNPYYPPVVRHLPNTKPWPQYRPPQQRHTTLNSTTNTTQNWVGNNRPINISSLVNNTANATHPPTTQQDTTPPIVVTTPIVTPPSTTTMTAESQTTLQSSTSTDAMPTTPKVKAEVKPQEVPEQPPAPATEEVAQVQALDEQASNIQPNYASGIPDGSMYPPGMNMNGEYIDQMNGK